jgi:hypothetical protein
MQIIQFDIHIFMKVMGMGFSFQIQLVLRNLDETLNNG